MMVKLLSCVAAALVVGVAANWRDPETPRSMEVIANYSGPLAAGEAARLECRAHGLRTETTLTWRRAEGAMEYNEVRGYSNLTLELTAAPALHGTQYYCFAPFSEPIDEYGRVAAYFLYSRRAELAVQGAPAPAFPTNARYVVMSSSAAGTTHRAGDVVSYTCTTYNMMSTFVTVIQAKDYYEMQLHVGMQPVRTLALNLTAQDHGTRVYCTVDTFDSQTFTTYTIVSNSVPINIE